MQSVHLWFLITLKFTERQCGDVSQVNFFLWTGYSRPTSLRRKVLL